MENKLAIKIFSLQQSIGSIEKDSKNPFFNSKYFDINKIIETLKPVLKETNLVILQPITFQDGKNILNTYITDTETGETLESSIVLPENLDPQKLGSAITYYRRYAIQSMLLLEAEDDDAQMVSKPVVKENPAVSSFKRGMEKSAETLDKEKIVGLIRQLDPSVKTSDQYSKYVKEKTGDELKAENYKTIIDKLEILVAESI